MSPLKKTWPALREKCVPHDTRDEVVDFVVRWSGKTGIAKSAFVGWLGISGSKYYDWSARYGKANEHNARIPREHWHIDISCINVGGTFYYLCCVLDGCSRVILHWEIKEQMKETDIELILLRAKEKHPCASPRIISDNGPQFGIGMVPVS